MTTTEGEDLIRAAYGSEGFRKKHHQLPRDKG